MRNIRHLCLFICIITSLQLYALEKPQITLEGNAIDYDHVSKNILASGNIVLTYKNYTIHAENLDYRMLEKTIQFPGTATVIRGNTELKIENFTYDFKTYNGQADNIDGHVSKLNIKSKNALFSPENIQLIDTTVSTCGCHDTPRYDLTAHRLFIYPQIGLFAAFDNWLTTTLLPFPLWIPTYVYRSHHTAAAAIPSIGTNKREGLYIKQQFGYFLNPLSNGSTDIGDSQRLGLYVGINHTQTLDPENSLRASLYYTQGNNFDGGLTYHRNFLKKKAVIPTENEDFLSSFTQSFPSLAGQFSAQATFKEIINDSLVSKAPYLSLEIEKLKLPHSNLDFFYSLHAGHIREVTLTQNIAEDSQYNINFYLSHTQTLSTHWALTKALNYYGYWHDQHEPWQRLAAEFTLTSQKTFLSPVFIYRKLLASQAQSPFTFQSNYEFLSDEVGFNLSHKIGNTEFAIHEDYILNTHRPRNLDYTVLFHLTCFKLSLSWRSVQEQAQLGVELL